MLLCDAGRHSLFIAESGRFFDVGKFFRINLHKTDIRLEWGDGNGGTRQAHL